MILKQGNSSGLHACDQSLLGFYYYFPMIPFQYSALSNIFVSMFLRSRDYKTFSNEKWFCHLLNLINKLEGPIQIYFILAGVMGNNLALNYLLGF